MIHDEMIKVIEAFRDGKLVQSRHRGASEDTPWRNSPSCNLPNFGMFEYRVREEPMELWVNITTSKASVHSAYTSSGLANYAAGCDAVRTVKFVEVIE